MCSEVTVRFVNDAKVTWPYQCHAAQRSSSEPPPVAFLTTCPFCSGPCPYAPLITPCRYSQGDVTFLLPCALILLMECISSPCIIHITWHLLTAVILSPSIPDSLSFCLSSTYMPGRVQLPLFPVFKYFHLYILALAIVSTFHLLQSLKLYDDSNHLLSHPSCITKYLLI